MSIDQLKAAVESASSEVRAAYVSFIVFALYFAVTVGATTHEELLRGSHVTMPALGVGLPIVGFYVLVPPLFFLFHAQLLIQLNVLAARARQLQAAGVTAKHWFGPPFVLTQFLLGSVRGPLLRPLVGLAMAVSLILLPVGLLVFVQVRFLPYHSPWVTAWHRILVVVDLGLVWLFWPRIRQAAGGFADAAMPRGGTRCGTAALALLARSGLARHLRRAAPTLVLLLTLTLLGFSFGLATIPAIPPPPGEQACAAGASANRATAASAVAPPPAYERCGWNPITYFATVSLPPPVENGPARTVSCLSYLLFEAPTTPLNMRRNLRVHSAVLVVAPPPAGVIEELGLDEAWLEHSRGLDLRGRDLRYADLFATDLRKADLRGADLFGASLNYADLRYVEGNDVPRSAFGGCPGPLQRGEVCRSRLTSANLQNADLRLAKLRQAELSGANLSYAKLQGIDLDGARMCDARLVQTALHEAKLHGVQLDRAKLEHAWLPGADLSKASLTDADLRLADLSFARLDEARLARADLTQARLDGAYLAAADLTAARLGRAYLSGASLVDATLEDAQWDDRPEGEQDEADRKLTEASANAANKFRSTVGQVRWNDGGDATLLAFPGWSTLPTEPPDPLAPVYVAKSPPGPDHLQDYYRELMDYERDLATLLLGKVCRPDADPLLVRSLVRRMVEDITRHGYRPHHRQIASFLLAQFAPPERDQAQAVGATECQQVLEMRMHMRDSLRKIATLNLDVEPKKADPAPPSPDGS